MAHKYFHFRMEETLERQKSIQTRYGIMWSCSILYTECNAFGIVMEAMPDIFEDMAYQCLVIYFGNIILYFRTLKEYVGDWKQVLQQLEEQKFYSKESKC